ncbi:hypothetical protein TIFTF001_022151 [Ficus carica]|uniref:Uncharacterized protein n=1 Tax=Ficus carica TaxID=3494 RepID=A0AA88AC03_FICCA|nr:hypothetical protein TIFTF001_022151 [Ficus carica]
MAVLRSRETVPTEATPKTQRARKDDAKLEPCTPAQTKELSPSSHQVQMSVSTGSGSGSVPLPGVVPRRSLRLASKTAEPDADGLPRDSVESGGRRRRRGAKNGSPVEVAGSAEEKAKNEDLREILRVLDDGIEELNTDSGLEEAGFCLDSGNSGETKGKRKLKEDGVGIGVLSLRSGKRVAKRGNDEVDGEKQVQELGDFGRDKGKGILDSKEESGELDVAETIPEIRKGKRKTGASSEEEELIGGENGDNRKRRGNGQLVEEDGVETEVENKSGDNAVTNEGQARNEQARNEFMERFRDIARRNASRFAHFDAEEEGGDELPSEVDDETDIEDWPGPFSTALKIVRDREKRNLQSGSSAFGETKPADVDWFPKNSKDRGRPKKDVPSLQELSLRCLADNADKLVSLDNIPDCLRHQLSQLLCDSRRMDAHFFKLLVQGSPTEVRLKDCSRLTEDEFTKSFQNFDPSNLVVCSLIG